MDATDTIRWIVAFGTLMAMGSAFGSVGWALGAVISLIILDATQD